MAGRWAVNLAAYLVVMKAVLKAVMRAGCSAALKVEKMVDAKVVC